MVRRLLALAALSGFQLCRADETTLFDSRGRSAAYIAEDFTIYLWSGKAVAYLYPDASRDGSHIYGFNGKHLGWFVRGIARDHEGDGACGIKEVFSQTEIEPIKSIKEISPIKSIREIPPIRPIFSRSWSATSCRVFLFEGLILKSCISRSHNHHG